MNVDRYLIALRAARNVPGIGECAGIVALVCVMVALVAWGPR